MADSSAQKIVLPPTQTIANKKLPSKNVEAIETFRKLRTWVDDHIMPILAWVGLIGLAVIGAITIFAHLDHSVRIIASVFAVAFLAFKLR